MRHRLLSHNSSLKTLLRADLVLSMAGGDSSATSMDCEGFYTLHFPDTSNSGRKAPRTTPQTIGPFRHRISKTIARFILNSAELIYSRDHNGEQATRRLLDVGDDNTKVRFCYDLGFDVDPAHGPALTASDLSALDGSPVVGLNISGLLITGGYSHNNMFGLKVEYSTFMFKLIQFLIEKRSAIVLLIPHVFRVLN